MTVPEGSSARARYSLSCLLIDPSWGNLLDFGLDLLGVVPGAPSLGTFRRAGRLQDSVRATARSGKTGHKSNPGVTNYLKNEKPYQDFVSKKGKELKKSRNSKGTGSKRTFMGKGGKRYYKSKPQPGMRGPVKLPNLGDRDPDFTTTGASFFDSRLPFDKRGEVARDPAQFGEAMKDLKREWKKDPLLKERFTKQEQKRFLEAFGDMSKGEVTSGRVKGFTWHHSTDAFGTGKGKMGGGVLQLLDTRLHKANIPHNGGRFIMGGGR